MRRRLLTVLLVLMGTATLLLCVPLGDAYARGRTEHLLLQRRSEAVRFADLAERMRTEADRAELSREIDRYAQLYGASVAVVDTAGDTLVRAGAADSAGEAGMAEAQGRALTGRSTDRLPTIRPWGPRSVVVAEPVGRDERVSGAVLMTLPTSAARRDVTLRWGLLSVAAFAAFAAAALVAVGIARWLLRPVLDLDRAVERLAAGSFGARADADSGPPELRRLRRHFNAMAQAVAESDGRRRDFVADASHQLRNPLATLVLRMENVERYVAPGPGRAEHAGALDEAERLEELLDGLLVLARVESAPAELREQDVTRAVRERVAAWGPVFQDAGLELTADELPERLVVRALPDAVGRVLDALLDNAVKFVPPGGGVEVRVSRGVRGEALVRVSDDGPGVAPDQLPLLLRRFARAPEHQNVRGSGLGLAIAEEIARVGGGGLEARANEPHGLVVELRLPVVRGFQPYTER
ncbi:HAMP domain-containing sensor histidine kinase [Streptomyces sp. RerS4]|uniref:HAMP domain-containing sensor histidine kinase n=1 Tax=Streptomyces sp. RerS4 TaxID=2942449 RepID=UPI00201C00FD|nr:HAMP domain-containing sensor histidine kinase [Streptomyces sp. RerS4]UQW99508.1 HAMP domain-containing histidine kinase [Streptomyces sp. RerS4]